jgi:hypothetical protein
MHFDCEKLKILIFIEKQAEDPLPLGDGMNAVPTAFETEAKSISS